MRSAPPGVRVAELAAQFGVSPRTLQRLFDKHVGTSPKQVLQRFRRQHVVDHLDANHHVDLSRLAAEFGYYDQAHLARDFGTTLARSPSAVADPSTVDELGTMSSAQLPATQRTEIATRLARLQQDRGHPLRTSRVCLLMTARRHSSDTPTVS